jgi:hypothetical protein
LYSGEQTGFCICEYEGPDECGFDGDNGDNGVENNGGNANNDVDSKYSVYDDDDDGNVRRRLTTDSIKKPRHGNDEKDGGGNGGIDGGINDGGGSDSLLFSANCFDCDCLVKPCSCIRYGYNDRVTPGQRENDGDKEYKDGKGNGGKGEGRKRQRHRRRQINGGNDDVNQSHIRSRGASRFSISGRLHKVVESGRSEEKGPSDTFLA